MSHLPSGTMAETVVNHPEIRGARKPYRRSSPPPFGAEELRLPDALRGPFKRHLALLREYYRQHGWGGSVGFGPTEKDIYKRSASCFKGTDLHDNLSSLGIDTLIVTGVQTSHCVYATCRYAVDSYRVIVPQDAVGDRCELMHEVNLFDIELELADVLPRSQVIEYLEEVA